MSDIFESTDIFYDFFRPLTPFDLEFLLEKKEASITLYTILENSDANVSATLDNGEFLTKAGGLLTAITQNELVTLLLENSGFVSAFENAVRTATEADALPIPQDRWTNIIGTADTAEIPANTAIVRQMAKGERIYTLIRVPSFWDWFKVVLTGTNVATSSGNVATRIGGRFRTNGESMAGGSFVSDTLFAASASAGILNSLDLIDNVPNTPGSSLFLLFDRLNVTEDTLGNDYGLYGIDIVKVDYDPSDLATNIPTAAEALSGRLTVVTGDTFTNNDALYDHAFDARVWTAVTTVGTSDANKYPFRLGNTSAGRRQAVIGGIIDHEYDPLLTWQELKADYDGAGLLLDSSEFGYINGIRIRNEMDGIRVYNNSRTRYMEIRNVWMQGIRDDCIENDHLLGGLYKDILFEDCYTGVSQQNGALDWNGLENLVIEDYLLSQVIMPWDDGGGSDPQHGASFKWQAAVPAPTSVSNAIIYPEQAVEFTDEIEYEDVILIWAGGGSYPFLLPNGITLRIDPSIWNNAVTNFKSRHGITDWTTVDMAMMVNPTAMPSVFTFE